MSTPHTEFEAAFHKFLNETSVADATSVAANIFVRLVVWYAQSKDEDPTKKITVNFGDARSITIHARHEEQSCE